MKRSTKVPKPPRRADMRLAPPKHAERRHARPGAGIKRSRAQTLARS